MRATEKIRSLYESALGVDTPTEYAIEDFLNSPNWDDDGNGNFRLSWDDIILAALRDITKRLEYRMTHPASFRGDD